ncbi:hypothetical protein LBMAG18_01120 [Alphaproteobacteria bacterium]|nr:hypothetical protein LBMAG18_01120 [Alphaproteobacteria bacterium]
MPKFSNNINFPPSFLFEEETAKSYISGKTVVDLRKAIKGDGNAFSLLLSLNNQPKKSLYFDYNSFLLLKSHDEISLVLAKIKLEGFEVFLVFKKCDRIIAQEVNQDL